MLRARVPAEKWSQPCTVGEPAPEAFADDAAVAELLGSLAGPAGLRTARDPAFLRWRYGLDPLRYRVLLRGAGIADGVRRLPAPSARRGDRDGPGRPAGPRRRSPRDARSRARRARGDAARLPHLGAAPTRRRPLDPAAGPGALAHGPCGQPCLPARPERVGPVARRRRAVLTHRPGPLVPAARAARAGAATGPLAGTLRRCASCSPSRVSGPAGPNGPPRVLLPYLRDRGIDATVVGLVHRDEGDERAVVDAGFDVRFLRATHLPGRVRELRRLLDEVRAGRGPHRRVRRRLRSAASRRSAPGIPVLGSLVNTPYVAERLADPNVDRWKLAAVRTIDSTTARTLGDALPRRDRGRRRRRRRHRSHLDRDRITVVERGRDPVALGRRTPERRAAVRRRSASPTTST